MEQLRGQQVMSWGKAPLPMRRDVIRCDRIVYFWRARAAVWLIRLRHSQTAAALVSVRVRSKILWETDFYRGVKPLFPRTEG